MYVRSLSVQVAGSILRNSNVAGSLSLRVARSILRNGDVARSILRKGQVAGSILALGGPKIAELLAQLANQFE